MTATAQPAPVTRIGFDPSYLPEFEAKLFIEGPQTARRLTNFFALLLFSTVIATYGVLSSSTATVIGAMIVAPLMAPIMATTAAVVTGSPSRALRALALTVVGIATVILFSFLLALVVPNITISFTSNGEITSRINPGLYALFTALGAGAAGAFIISRAEISDSMGGVAIAISLVPPLCVVGIALQAGRFDDAAGAMLLFMTNYLAILLAGGVTFVALGMSRLAGTQEQARLRHRGIILFLIGILIIAIPLTLSAYRDIVAALENDRTTVEVEKWLEGTTYKVVTVNVDDQQVIITVEGIGRLNPLAQLADRISTALGHTVQILFRALPAQVVASGGP